MPLQIHRTDAAADRLAFARGVVHAEAAALDAVARRLGPAFLDAADLIDRATRDGRGRVAVTGVGKSADVGRKIAGTLNSLGVRAYPLDATAALHGDLGMLHPDDVALALSHSGESEELVRLLGPLRPLVRAVVALTGSPASTLARQAAVAVAYGPLDEVCPLGLAPSASTTAMLALGDALAFTVGRARGVTRDDFARYHPAGSLGRRLLKVEAVMRHGADLRVAPAADTVRAVFAASRVPGRRTGAVLLVDADGALCGLFTDSDLARLVEARRDAALDRPIAEVMTRHPRTVPAGTRLPDAVETMRRYKISELPVLGDGGRPVGLLDITDLIGLGPAAPPAPEAA